MQHTPYGYDIIGGKAVVNEEQASNIHKICDDRHDSYQVHQPILPKHS